MSLPSVAVTPKSIRRQATRTRLLGSLRVFIGRIPPVVGNRLADGLGEVVYAAGRKSRRNAISNMSHVLGPRAPRKELKRAVHGVFHNVMRNYYDLCRAPEMPVEKLEAAIDFDWEGWQRVVDFQAQKRPVILVTAHFGSFDLMTQVIMSRGLPLTVLIARVKPAWLTDFITNMRGARGVKLVEVDEEEGSGLNLGALKQSVALLRSGGMLGVLADRNMEQAGITINFFGKPARVAGGVAKMARRTDSAIVPAICYRLPGGRYSITFEEPILPPHTADADADIRQILVRIFSRLEYHIRRSPSQWVILQPVWRT